MLPAPKNEIKHNTMENQRQYLVARFLILYSQLAIEKNDAFHI